VAGPTTGAEEAQPRAAAPDAGAGTGTVRRRRRRRLAALLAAVAMAGAIAWLLYASSWLRATTVTVTGTHVLTGAQVRAAAGIPLGGPLVSVDTDAVAQRLGARLRRIDAVDVSRSWPHTVTLKVTERTASALIPGSDGRFTEVDDDGVRFATVSTAPRGVPLLKLAPSPTATASTRFFGIKRLLRAGVEVAENLPSAVRRDARVITVGGYDSITVELSGGRTVTWGSPREGGRKAAALTALLKAAKGAADFDVSAPSAPAASGG
jgi:cell division protein FtsQ